MARSGFKLYLVRELSVDEPSEAPQQIGDVFLDWSSAMQALHEYYAAHGGVEDVRRTFRGGIRVEWLHADDAQP
jgi:hypothetical protein